MPGRVRKAQSAMEYLMTYGWAILIIAVVLGALFQLGVFNSGTFSPRAPPGACQVFRPNGPNNVQFVNLEGVCSGELPQYVAQLKFNSGGIISAGNQSDLQVQKITLAAWINPVGINTWMLVAEYQYGGWGTFYMAQPPGTSYIAFGVGNGGTYAETPALNSNQWYFLTGIYDGSTISIYLDGTNESHTSFAGPLTYNTVKTMSIGSGQGFNEWNGTLANIQLYNTTLSANEIQALYLEGVGGAPIKLSNLVGWWPLNGNANDYSGNDNNGQASGSGVSYTSQWAAGYTPP
ncbi:MAG: LamG domain-containing protein [Candidatus Marsarchaeota archaeon]|nr:LamG domain-containing protein [Candidatus Marsarchaeota archaeon]